MSVNFDNIPEQLTHPHVMRWCVFRCYWYPGKIEKVPFTPLGTHAAINRKDTWSNFKSCIKAIEYGIGHLPGFALTKDYALACIDVDHCIQPDGKLSETARKYIDGLKSGAYIERSVSGKGLHIFVWYTGKELPYKPETGVEIFPGKDQFVAFTGDCLE